MTIAFVHHDQAFLPELNAYHRFFSTLGYTCLSVSPDELGQVHRQVEWFFMGTDISKPREGIYKIHEYISASTPPFRKWKDQFKHFINSQPDFRLFQNEFVRKSLGFDDAIPWGYRDMGVSAAWLLRPVRDEEKPYDFIYAGDCSPSRKLDKLLDQFTGPMKDSSIIILSRNYESLAERYRPYSNIHFEGPVASEEVPDWLNKARFAINYMPDEAPFNRQTSTKFLEYAACRIPIVSSRYAWVEGFEREYGGKYFYLEKDLSNLTKENVEGFGYGFPDLREWTWDEQIRGCGVVEFLEGVGNF